MLRVQLRQEKAVAQKAIDRHKALAKQLARVQVDCKTDAERELSEMRAEAHRREATAQAELQRREAVIGVLRDDKRGGDKTRRELAVALEKERALEKQRHELAQQNSELAALHGRQRAELAQAQAALADAQRQLALVEKERDRAGGAELVSMYQQEKARADRLQDLVDVLKK